MQKENGLALSSKMKFQTQVTLVVALIAGPKFIELTKKSSQAQQIFAYKNQVWYLAFEKNYTRARPNVYMVYALKDFSGYSI